MKFSISLFSACSVAICFIIAPVNISVAEPKEIIFTYKTIQEKEIVVRDVRNINVSEYLPAYKLQIGSGEVRSSQHSPESVVSEFIAGLVKGDVSMLLAVSDPRQKEYIRSWPKDESEKAKEYFGALYTDTDVYVTHRGNMSNILILSVTHDLKGTMQGQRLPFYLKRYNQKWKITAKPYKPLSSAIFFGFPGDGEKIIYKSKSVVGEIPTFDFYNN